MQHPIGHHALLANGRTAALVDPFGNVAWMCWPRIDSDPLLLSLLDEERGGVFQVCPAGRATLIERSYEPGTLILRTRWACDGGQLLVEDALVWEPSVLLRTVTAVQGEVDVEVRCRFTGDWGRRALPLVRSTAGLQIGDGELQMRWLRASGGGSAGAEGYVGIFRVTPSGSLLLALGSGGDLREIASMDAVRQQWRARLDPTHMPEPSPLARLSQHSAQFQGMLTLSSAVLLGLRQRNGGIVAAPTTSLPQWPGSGRCWDYRYSWLRDSALAGLAMLRLGLADDAYGLGDFLGHAAAGEAPPVMVRVDGSAAPAEEELGHLTGYHGARPVRLGNGAAGQPQLDVAGELLELARALAESAELPPSLAVAAARVADWTAAHWADPDHGIWEIRGLPHSYTHSRVMAWSGLRDAVWLQRHGLIRGDANAWEAAAAALHRATAPASGPLLLHEGGGGPDAGLAQVPIVGFLAGDDLRVSATLDMISARLDRGGLIDRYEGQPDELGDPCAPFLFPTFWFADALQRCGRDGTGHFDAAFAARGDLGLFGEVADPATRTPLGNYPQVQSHAALVLAATEPVTRAPV